MSVDNKKKNILFIAPLPPPISGHTLVSKVLFNYLSRRHNVKLINLIHNSNSIGSFSLKRFRSVIKVLKEVYYFSKNNSSIYLTISESFLGNLKDLMIYFLLSSNLENLSIHLHGGSIDKMLFRKNFILKFLNSFFYKRASNVIISGNSHRYIFSMVSKKRLVVIPNFVPGNKFIESNLVTKKFNTMNKINIIYLSAMDKKKGYMDLLEGIEEAEKILPDIFEVNFAGKFSNDLELELFKSRISNKPNITYHGFVDDYYKNILFKNAHIFCLPTKYFEGQPISILEAYASGCVVLTTNKPGILDIFENNLNGYLIDKRFNFSISRLLISIIKNPSKLLSIAQNNLKLAKENYQEEIYCKRIESIL